MRYIGVWRQKKVSLIEKVLFMWALMRLQKEIELAHAVPVANSFFCLSVSLYVALKRERENGKTTKRVVFHLVEI